MATQLEIIREFPFDFYGTTYRAYLGSDRNLYIRIADICDAVGLALSGQMRRIQETYAISHKLTYIEVDTPYQNTIRKQSVAHLNIEGLTYWLATIDEKRVRPEIRERVRTFQRDFVDTVWMLYRSDIVSDVILAELDAYKSPAKRELSEMMDQARSVLNKLADFEGRLARIEGFVSDTAIINVQQQWQVQEMINAVAEALYESKKGKMPKTQCFALCHNDFKSMFRVPVYSMLSADQMQEAINYLAQRYQHCKPGAKLPQIFTDGSQQSLL